MTKSKDNYAPLFGMLNSPVAQAHSWGIDHSYEWQKAVWMSCWSAWRNCVVLTHNESGKTKIVVPVLALSWAAAFPGSTVVITSKSDDQISQQLWPTISNMAKGSNWNISSNTIKAPSVMNGVPGSEIYTRVTKEGTRFEGYHNASWYQNGKEILSPLLIIADEAKSISPDIFEAIERCNPCVRLYISSTGDDSGDLYDAWNDDTGIWTKGHTLNNKWIEFKIPWTMSPHLYENESVRKKKEYEIKKRGKTDPFICSNLLAEFFRGGSYMVFDDNDLQKASEAMNGIRPKMNGYRCAYCDLSSGGDELTFGVRDGNYVYPLTTWHHDGTVAPEDTAKRYINLFKRYKLRPREIAADSGGSGKEIVNQIHKMGWPIRRVTYNYAPRDKKAFVDRYTELHWELKSILQTSNIILPKDSELLKQMRIRRYIRRNSDENRVKTEPKEDARKKRTEKSPDRLDTIVYLCDNMESYKVPDNYNPQHTCPTPEEFFEKLKNEANGLLSDESGTMPSYY